MTPLDLAKAFIAKGREDESILDLGVNDDRIADGVFGFHAQQAVEKYLKAVLAIDQERPERTHDLGVLADQCRQAGHMLPAELDDVILLSRFAVQERYPLAIASPIEREEALRQVATLREWVEGEIRQAS